MKFEKTVVYGFIPALRGCRNPLNSWERTDSTISEYDISEYNVEGFFLGKNDLALAQKLIKAGAEHCKFLRQIQVWVDISMPRYWWSEFDTYHFNSKNSCSTMHKLFDKNTSISLDMFVCNNDYEKQKTLDRIADLNHLRDMWLILNTQDAKDNLLITAKRILPENFIQMRTVNTNYAELRNIYIQRKNHRLKVEWQEYFCKWVESLPYAKELILCQ